MGIFRTFSKGYFVFFQGIYSSSLVSSTFSNNKEYGVSKNNGKYILQVENASEIKENKLKDSK